MTDALNHAELSRELALALGYYPESVRVKHEGTNSAYCQVYRKCRLTFHEDPYWLALDYRSPDVALPLLAWLMRHHSVSIDHYFSGWVIRVYGISIQADTLEEVIARACIAVGGK